jgi:hypothetical protein
MSVQSVVCNLAKVAHKRCYSPGKSVGNQTRKAHKTCKVWQDAVLQKYSQRFRRELALNANSTGQRIDLVDTKDRVAYELKASQNNVHMEVYRDVFKALVYNVRNPKTQVCKLVFIAPAKGIAGLGKEFTKDVTAIARRLGLELVLHGI